MKKNFLALLLCLAAFACNKSQVSNNPMSHISLEQLSSSYAVSIKEQIESSKALITSNAKVQTTVKTIVNQYGLRGDDYTKIVFINFDPVYDYYQKLFRIKLLTEDLSTSSKKVNVVNPNPGVPVGTVGITGDTYPEHATDSFNIVDAASTPQANTPTVQELVPFQSQYIAITRSYDNLTNYTNRLNTLENTVYNSTITEAQKSSVIYQIEFLKAYAADLENNLGYYQGLIDGTTPVGIEKVGSKISTNSLNLIVNKRQGCKVNVGDVLMGGIVSGFWTGVTAAASGAAGGTIVLPGGGTVSGAVGGFMAGFASGFVVGTIQGTISSLMRTCGK